MGGIDLHTISQTRSTEFKHKVVQPSITRTRRLNSRGDSLPLLLPKDKLLRPPHILRQGTRGRALSVHRCCLEPTLQVHISSCSLISRTASIMPILLDPHLHANLMSSSCCCVGLASETTVKVTSSGARLSASWDSQPPATWVWMEGVGGASEFQSAGGGIQWIYHWGYSGYDTGDTVDMTPGIQWI